MMKRIVSILVALVIILGSAVLSVSAAFVPQDVRGTEFEDDVELLINLGFIEYTEYGMFKPYSHITRAEYAVLLDKVMKNRSFSDKDVFLDVDSEHYARNSINKLYEAGYVSGDGGTYFRPDDDIKYNEALKIMVSILGYDTLANQKGGYPEGYIYVAASTGITKGISSDGEYINRGNAVRLLINTFDENPVETDFSKGTLALKIRTDKTMLSEQAEIYYVKDYVNANSEYAINGQKANPGHLYIGKEEMIAPAQYDEYVGYQVECWYHENDNDEKEILYLRKSGLRVEYTKIDAKDINKIEGYTCKYYNENQAEKQVKFSGETVFIYNGRQCMYFDDSLFDFTNGWVEFLDNDAD